LQLDLDMSKIINYNYCITKKLNASRFYEVKFVDGTVLIGTGILVKSKTNNVVASYIPDLELASTNGGGLAGSVGRVHCSNSVVS